MAEALAGLGVAANVAQFVGAGLKVAAFLHEVYTSSTGLTKHHNELQLLSVNFQTASKRLKDIQSSPASRDGELQQLVEKCLEVSTELSQSLASLTRDSSRSDRTQKVRLMVKAVWMKGKIEELSSRLDQMTRAVAFQLMSNAQLSATNTSSQMGDLSVAVQAQQTEVLSRLDSTARDIKALHEKFDGAGRTESLKLLESMSTVAIQAAEYCIWRKRVEDVLRSLYFEQLAIRKSAIKQAHAETFEWALDPQRTTLSEWLESGSGVYWIEGKAGSGKSTLMKFLERHAETHRLLASWSGDRPLIVATHYFWCSSTGLQRSLVGLFRTLLFHILMSHPKEVLEICPRRLDHTSYRHLEPWSLEELRECFQRLANSSNLHANFCFFIDGLDEFRGESDETLTTPDELISFIKSMSSAKNIKICASSRPWPEFKEAFGSLSGTLRVEDLTKKDIRIYVDDKLSESQYFHKIQLSSPSDAAEFASQLTVRADGVFLWVYYATKNLLRGLTLRDDIDVLRERLLTFPLELEDYFARMLESIEPVYHRSTSEVLQIIATAQFPVSMKDLLVHQEVGRMTDRKDDEAAMRLTYPKAVGKQKANRDKPVTMTSDDDWDASRFTVNWSEKTYDSPLGNRTWGNPFARPNHPTSPPGSALRLDDEPDDRIIGHCKDLIHAWYPDNSPSAVSSPEYPMSKLVGFLHRTVADFLELPRASKIIQNRLRSYFDPQVAMSLVYLRRFQVQLDQLRGMGLGEEPTEAPTWLLRALYLVKRAGDSGDPDTLKWLQLNVENLVARMSHVKSPGELPQWADWSMQKGFLTIGRIRTEKHLTSAFVRPLIGVDPDFMSLPPRLSKIKRVEAITEVELKDPDEVAWMVLLLLLGRPRLELSNSGEVNLEIEKDVDLQAWSGPQANRLLRRLLADTSQDSLFMLLITYNYARRNRKKYSRRPGNLLDLLKLLIALGAPRYTRLSPTTMMQDSLGAILEDHPEVAVELRNTSILLAGAPTIQAIDNAQLISRFMDSPDHQLGWAGLFSPESNVGLQAPPGKWTSQFWQLIGSAKST